MLSGSGGTGKTPSQLTPVSVTDPFPLYPSPFPSLEMGRVAEGRVGLFPPQLSPIFSKVVHILSGVAAACPASFAGSVVGVVGQLFTLKVDHLNQKEMLTRILGQSRSQVGLFQLRRGERNYCSIVPGVTSHYSF